MQSALTVRPPKKANPWSARLMSLGLAVALLLPMAQPARTAPAAGSTESAADLRMKLSSLYGEFALLSWGAVLTAPNGKRNSEGMFNDAVAALDDNTNRLGRLYGQIYGDKVGSDFVVVWKKQVAAMLEYARAAAKKNTAATDQTGKFLLNVYPSQLAGFISPLSRGARPLDQVVTQTRDYLQNFKAVADAQAVRDFNNEYRALDQMYAAMGEIAHQQATAAQLSAPTRFVGNMDMPAVNLRVKLNTLFAQQMFTLAMANRANVNSNIDEFYALFSRSDLLTDEISRELGTYGGAEFTSAFSALWKKYTASLQDYEKARESQDHTMQKRVLGDIAGEQRDVVALFVPSTPPRAVPPPKKGGKKPKAPPPPPFFKDVKAFMDANVAVIMAETKHASPFGLMQRAWNDTRQFSDAMCLLMVGRFGDKPANSTQQSEGK